MGHDPPKQHGRAIDHTDPGGDARDEQRLADDVPHRTQPQLSTQPLPSPAASAHSATPSNPTSSTSSGHPPRLISDEGSSSSPSSAAFQTPENMSNLDPFSSLSITAIPETDGLSPIGEDSTAPQNTSSTTPASHPPTRPLPPNLPLTSESLRPLNDQMGAPRGSTASTPSVASSGRSERRDRLGPLPSQRATPLERPSMTRSQPSPSRPSPPPPPPPRTSAPGRIPLPSPPALGLSDLLTGGSPLGTPSNDQGYFAGALSDSSSLTRSNSNGASRRTPHYSPFRSYYGPAASPGQAAAQGSSDQLSRRSETQRASQQSGLEWQERPKLGDGPTHVRAATSTAVSLSALAAEASGSTPFPQSEQSRAGSATSGSTGAGRSPRIQNTGGVLAPHGSFTTARAPKKKKKPEAQDQPRAPKMAPASDSQLYVGNMRKMDLSEAALAAQAERDALEHAARSGDQLAMYRLGWVAEMPRGQRYKIGSIEDVWGPSSPSMTETPRSSFSSRSSRASFSSTAQERTASRSGTPSSDLFQDAADLALRDNAGRNRSGSAYFDRPVSRPSSRPSTTPRMSPRP